MIKDSTHELMEKEVGEPIPHDRDNEWLKQLSGGAKPRPALEGRLLSKPAKHLISSKQQRGVRYGK